MAFLLKQHSHPTAAEIFAAVNRVDPRCSRATTYNNLRDLVKVGEQTGDLGGTLEKVGQRYEKLIQMRIDRIMSVVPLMIIAALGLMVLLIAWSMLSGIFVAMHGLQGQGHH